MFYRQRWRGHRFELRKNKSKNGFLQEAWNRFGESAFEFKVLALVPDDKLIELEQQLIDGLNPAYNIVLKIGDFPPSFNAAKLSREAQNKRSESVKRYYQTDAGKRRADKHRQRMLSLGKHHPVFSMPKEELVKNGRLGAIALAQSGYKRSTKTKIKIGQANAKTYKGAISPDGKIYSPIHNMKQFCEQHDLGLSSMVALMRGRINKHKGWTRVE